MGSDLSVNRTLVEWAASLGLVDDAPVRALLLDHLGNAVGGAAHASVASAARVAQQFGGVDGLPAPGGRTAHVWAVLPWGAAAHALECDDTHQPSSSHPGAVIFPAVLAAGHETGADWPTVARAVVAGYEVMCRLGRGVTPAEEYVRGFHPTGTVGAFGATVATSIVQGASVDQMMAAMGIVGSLSSGSMSFLAGGAWTKHLHPGWAAHAGLIASTLALEGFVGPERVFERPYGYFAGHTSVADVETVVVKDLGTAPLAVAETSLKAHGCCRYEQGALDAVLHLVAERDIAVDDVARVRVGVLRAGWGIIADPIDAKRRPRSPVDAQFSMPFGVAVALSQGGASVHEHTQNLVDDPHVQQVMQRVECFQSDDLEREFPAKWPAIVHIDLTDGSTVTHAVEYPKGDPENPFSGDELVEKFRTLTQGLSQELQDGVIEAVDALRRETSLDPLFEALEAAFDGR